VVFLIIPLTCPTCNGSMSVLADRSALLCPSCGARFPLDTNDWFYRLSNDEPLQERSLLSHQEPALNPELTSFAVSLIVRTLREAVRMCDPQTVLDIGCGNGGYAESLYGLYTSYIGIDPSEIPTWRRLRKRPRENVILVHTDPLKALPVTKGSIDLIMLLASYDHIPNRQEITTQLWGALKPSGFILVTMSNYAFWPKRLLNFILRRQVLRHEHVHFCVHNPTSLAAEILSGGRDGELYWSEADNIYVPNSQFRLFYKNRTLLACANWLLRSVIHGLLGLRDCGSTMTVVIRKSTA
jgi:SAM-dependent methyltransferase